MGLATCHICVPLDGYVAGPDMTLSGERLMPNVGDPVPGPSQVIEVIASPAVTHVRYRVGRS